MSSFKPTKVTPDKFAAVRKALDETCLSNEAICRQFGIGKTTLRIIKKADTYDAYKRAMARNLAIKRARRAGVSADTSVAAPAEKPQDIYLNVPIKIIYRRTAFDFAVSAVCDVCVALVILVLILLAINQGF